MSEPIYADHEGASPQRRAKIAYAMGADNTPAPGWVTDDDQAWAAYKRGLATHHTVLPFAPPKKRKPGTRARTRTSPANPTPPASAPPAEPSPGAPAGRWWRRPADAAAPKVASAVSSDAGGVLLALVLYPLVLATIQHGAAGPGAWFRAKWLNQTQGQLPDGSQGTRTTPSVGDQPDLPGTHPRHGPPAPSTPGPRGTKNAKAR